MNDAVRLRKRQPAQEEIVNQTEDRGVETDAEREGEEREKSEPGRLQQLAESEAKIGHHVIKVWDAVRGAFGFNQ